MTPPRDKPSFTPYRRWRVGLHVCFLVLVVFSVLVMTNYLAQDYFLRLQTSTRTKTDLSPLTIKLLDSLTNRVKVTLCYDRDDPFYSLVSDLVSQYGRHSSKISITTVDYLRDPPAAQKIRTGYNLVTTNKNFVIFDCEGRVKVAVGDQLSQYVLEQVPSGTELEFRRKPTAFYGERLFTGALLAVTNPKTLTACFLRGHGEHSIEEAGDEGYSKFATILQQNCIRSETLLLAGANAVPTNCDLLVIAGPRGALSENELGKIDQYLNQGGRLMVLFRDESIDKITGHDAAAGLAGALAKWGVDVGHETIQDPDNSERGPDVVVSDFDRRHSLVNPLINSFLFLVRPRAIGQSKAPAQTADAPRVDELAFTGPKAFGADRLRPRRFPLMVAVEKGAVQNAINERGSTRILVIGDSWFLADEVIDATSAENRQFAGYAANWLLDRTQLLGGIGPRRIDQYMIVMTTTQLQTARWILLAGMPGGALLLGGLVWLRRRK
jgi:hypothetical protein